MSSGQTHANCDGQTGDSAVRRPPSAVLDGVPLWVFWGCSPPRDRVGVYQVLNESGARKKMPLLHALLLLLLLLTCEGLSHSTREDVQVVVLQPLAAVRALASEAVRRGAALAAASKPMIPAGISAVLMAAAALFAHLGESHIPEGIVWLIGGALLTAACATASRGNRGGGNFPFSSQTSGSSRPVPPAPMPTSATAPIEHLPGS